MDLVSVMCPACQSMDGPTAVKTFWWLTAVACILWAYLARRASRPTILLPHDVDPYVLASLREGPELAMRAALAGLTDRGLVEYGGGIFRRIDDAVPGRDLTYLESSVWSALATHQSLGELMESSVTQGAREDLQRRTDSSPYHVQGWRADLWRLGLVLVVPLAFAVYRIQGGIRLNLPVGHMVLSAIVVAGVGALVMAIVKKRQKRLDPRVALGVHDATVRHNLMREPSESTMPGVVGMAGWPVALTIMAVASSQSASSFYPAEMQEKMGPLLSTPMSGPSANGPYASCGSGSTCGSSSSCGSSGGSSCGGGGCGGGGCGSS